MSESPFASIGAALLAQGYSPLPIMPGAKAPGALVGSEWRLMRGWNKFCEGAPSAFQVGMWSKWPGGNVGVACGRGLIGLDIDRDELVEPIRAVVPAVVVAKRGRKGATFFFRCDSSKIPSRGYKVDGLGVLDVISHGKQTVLPPSLHMVTGEPYAWTTERTLADTPLSALTELTPEHMAAVVEVLVSFGYAPEPEILASAPREVDEDGELEFYRQLNTDALADLGAWVPKLGLSRLQRSGDGFRSVAEWRPSNSGNPIHKRPLLLGIKPTGIVDFGDGDKGYTPLNLVMAAFDADLDLATRWLGEAIGRDFRPKMVLNRNRAKPAPPPASPEAEDAARAYREASGGQVEADPAAEVDPFADFNLPDRPSSYSLRPKPAPEPAKPNPPVVLHPPAPPIPPAFAEAIEPLTRVPGLVGEIVEWMAASAQRPCRALYLPAALTLVGTLAGRNYASATDLRTNIYTLALADSGFGKDHARKCIKGALSTAGLTRFMGGEDIMSGSGMRKRVEEQPAIMWSMDEFGGFIRRISDQRNLHTFQIRDYLLKYTGSAADYMSGSDYAGERGTICYNPNVGLYGVSTPVDFYDALGSLSLGDGLIGRMMIFPVDGDAPDVVRPSATASKPPAEIVERLRSLVTSKVGGNLNGRLSDGSTACEALSVPWANRAAESLWYETVEHFNDRERSGPVEGRALWKRAAEQSQRVALILAIGVDPHSPEITADLLKLGREIVETCNASTIEAMLGRIADNPAQREHLDVKRWIFEAGPDGLSRTTLGRKVNGRFNARRLTEILEYLTTVSKEVVSEVRATGGRPGARFVSIRYMNDPEAVAGGA